MALLKRMAKAAARWAVANPAKAAEITIALAILGASLAATGRLERRALRRLVRIWL